MSIELLKDLHLLTRAGQLNADARRKLKQIRHLLGLLQPALDDALARHASPSIVDCGAGKSYLGALIYELVLGPAGRGTLTAIEGRAELSQQAADRAARFGQARFRVRNESIAAVLTQNLSAQSLGRASDADTPAAAEPRPSPTTIHAAAPQPNAGVDAAAAPRPNADAVAEARPNVVTALHACDTATDDALVLAIALGADHVAVVPCCQAEVARQLESAQPADSAIAALFGCALHRRELGSHLTNVVRTLALAAHGYKVTVTELVGWEHSAKNELILARRVHRYDAAARAQLRAVLDRFGIEPAVVRELAARGLDPRTTPRSKPSSGS